MKPFRWEIDGAAASVWARERDFVTEGPPSLTTPVHELLAMRVVANGERERRLLGPPPPLKASPRAVYSPHIVPNPVVHLRNLHPRPSPRQQLPPLPGELPRGSPRRTTPRGPPHGAPIHVLPMRPMYVPKPLFQHLNFP